MGEGRLGGDGRPGGSTRWFPGEGGGERAVRSVHGPRSRRAPIEPVSRSGRGSGDDDDKPRSLDALSGQVPPQPPADESQRFGRDDYEDGEATDEQEETEQHRHLLVEQATDAEVGGGDHEWGDGPTRRPHRGGVCGPDKKTLAPFGQRFPWISLAPRTEPAGAGGPGSRWTAGEGAAHGHASSVEPRAVSEPVAAGREPWRRRRCRRLPDTAGRPPSVRPGKQHT